MQMMSQMKLISRTSAAVRPFLDNRLMSTHNKNMNETEVTKEGVRAFCSVCDKYLGAGSNKSISMKNINPNIVALQYAVRGPLLIRALNIENELKKGVSKPFKMIIKANIGDAQAMGQKPITFIRQVLACATYPPIIESSDFPCDVKKKACELLQVCGGGSVGSYTVSNGIELIRKHVAAYIEARDGFKANYTDIAITAGATTAIKFLLELYAHHYDGKKSSVMISTPRYPLYSAALSEYGIEETGYYLDEDNNWGLSMTELKRSYDEGSKTKHVRAIVVINPGNPTGQVLPRQNIEDVIKFAYDRKMLVLADEVYQDNVYAEGSKFFSFKKVMMEMGEPYNKLELASFMSASKCYMGECGLRGGWLELCNFDPEVQVQLYKMMSAMLCCSSLAQICISCVAQPPKEGDPSYELYAKEKKEILSSLAERARLIVEIFNKMDGFKCNTVQGSMYAFPQIALPPKAIEAAKAANQLPDVFYAFKLLEETGICVIPGSGFGQRPGTWHFRTTILPQTPLLKEMLEIFQRFHAKFTKEYS